MPTTSVPVPEIFMSRNENDANAGRVGTDATIDDRETLLQRVVERVATEENVGPMALPPLADTIDPDILTRLTDCTPSGEEPVYLRFTYCDRTVIVDSDGDVTVSPGDDEPEH